MVEGLLFGDVGKIRSLAEAAGYSPPDDRIIHAPGAEQAVEEAVRSVSGHHPENLQADLLMKGLVDTSLIMRGVLNGEWGLREDRVMSHVALFELERYPKLLFLSDAAMTIAPTLDEKRQIVENAVAVAHGAGIPEPKVAILCAKEKVSDKMPATRDAEALAEMNRRGEITGCVIGGPFALDNAISPEAAQHKGVAHPGAGEADILIAPTIEAGNILYKALAFLAGARNAGIIVGARRPIVLTSRSDSDETKLNSLALATLA
jgi:phosphate butyryltransferase